MLLLFLIPCIIRGDNHENDQPMPDQANKIKSLQPVIYGSNNSSPKHYGLNPKATALIYPDLVLTDANGNPIAINYLAIIPILIQQIQQLQDQVNQLQNQNQQ